MTASIQKSWVIDQMNAGLTIKVFLQKKQDFSRSLLTAMKKEDGKFLINEKESYITETLKLNDQLTVIFPPEASGGIEATEMDLTIMYEDEDHLVLNKPAGQACLPSMNDRHYSLANGIMAYYESSEHPATVHIVTRLDRDTSGLVLVAKNRYVHALLSESQKRDQIKRIYETIITGEMNPPAGTINAPIARKKTSIIEREVNWKDGKKAVTEYQTLSIFSGASLLRVQLKTGRTHQIRVHFSHFGHPLLGDNLYGGKTDDIPRQALHCAEIEWLHPFLKKSIKLNCELPSDIAACKKRLSFNKQ